MSADPTQAGQDSPADAVVVAHGLTRESLRASILHAAHADQATPSLDALRRSRRPLPLEFPLPTRVTGTRSELATRGPLRVIAVRSVTGGGKGASLADSIKEAAELVQSRLRVEALDAMGVPWGPARWPWPAR